MKSTNNIREDHSEQNIRKKKSLKNSKNESRSKKVEYEYDEDFNDA